jgi:DNA-directed RNA polymerase subunit E"
MEKACRDCHRMVESGRSMCVCGSNSMSTDWNGYLVIIDPAESEIAKKLEIKRAGKYALKVR